MLIHLAPLLTRHGVGVVERDMKINTNELISTQLADALKWMLVADDYEKIANQYGRSAASLRQIAYRATPVSENSKVVVIEMIRTAIANANMVGQTLMHYA